MSPGVHSEGSHLTDAIHISSHNQRMQLQASTGDVQFALCRTPVALERKKIISHYFFCAEKSQFFHVSGMAVQC
jgi:hypothetical protein